MKITIKEIAELAGVHRSTVDKVLHNRAGVSDEVRARVRKIINEVGYKPNLAGRVLQKQGRTYRIDAILLDVDALPFLKKGIEQGIANQIGFDIDVEYSICRFRDGELQARYIENAIASGSDGIIISPNNSDKVRLAIDRAAGAGIPVITCNSDIEGTRRLCCVGMDALRASRIAGRLMGQFLGGTGKVAVISSAIAAENNSYYVKIREQGFIEFINTNYPHIRLLDSVESFEDPQITYNETVRLLRDNGDLKGIYITCGGVAQVGRALKESGRAEAVRVISYEEYPEIIELMKQDIIDCTLAGEISRQGQIPVNMIMDYLITGQVPAQEQVYTETRILVRESVI